MESILLVLILVAQLVLLILFFRKNARLQADIGTLYASIARDLNAITSTIAVYTGNSGGGSIIVPPGATPGEGVPPDAVDAARRKAELWRAMRARGR